MTKRVLIVDDDVEMLVSLKEGLSRYEETFSVLTALDGSMAVQELRRIPVSLVVTDLKMPNLDGFSLLAHIMEHYPEIPVLIITGYSTPEMERMAREGGAVGYIAKPFTIGELASRIAATLKKEADGGTLHSVSSGMFLQLMEMEERTCTIRLFGKTGGRRGILFFRDGELLDAKTGELRGEAAAHEIFSWDQVSLKIQNSCQQKAKKIKKDLQAILLEAVRLKDERRQQDPVALAGRDASPLAPVETRKGPSPINQLMDLINKEFDQGSGVEDIYYDDSWERLLDEICTLGSIFEGGELRAGYVDRGESRDFILVPREKVIVLSVNPRCPRDRIMEVLGAQ